MIRRCDNEQLYGRKIDLLPDVVGTLEAYWQVFACGHAYAQRRGAYARVREVAVTCSDCGGVY